jgi:hypothetical protein
VKTQTKPYTYKRWKPCGESTDTLVMSPSGRVHAEQQDSKGSWIWTPIDVTRHDLALLVKNRHFRRVQ